ncbi:hypothetical protein SeLEV6574_g01136 [Synchytrium endobioticum]|uniref:Uncharacterized protein n=1 Tax=Synchytrium endobioticum TaxID=286115 RepID=A0A507DE65_9FUNG|nr:hypothetical protein SeLEV6574_g01136 [Synchytrium endobioticum]
MVSPMINTDIYGQTTANLVAVGFSLMLFLIVLVVRDRDDKDWATPILIYNNIFFLTLALVLGVSIRRALGNIVVVFPDRHGPCSYLLHRLCVDGGPRKGPHNHLRNDSRKVQRKWNIGYLVVGFITPLIWVLITIPIMYISSSPNGCSRSWLPTINAQIGYIMYGLWMTGTFFIRMTFCTSSVLRLVKIRAKSKHIRGSKTAGAALLLRFVMIDVAVLTSSLNTVANIMFNAVTPTTVYLTALLTDYAYTKLITGAIFLPLAALFVFLTLATGAGPMAKYSALAKYLGFKSIAGKVSSWAGAASEKKAVTIKNMARLLIETGSTIGSILDKNNKDPELSVNAPETQKVVSSAAMNNA